MNRRVQIVDLDGCISNDRWRLSLINVNHPMGGNERYRKYHAGCAFDAFTNENELIEDCEKVILTARPVEFRERTLNWWRIVARQRPPVALIMRNNNDSRPTCIVKEEALDQLFEYGVSIGDIVLAIDDREDIIDMYKRHYLPTKLVKAYDKGTMHNGD